MVKQHLKWYLHVGVWSTGIQASIAWYVRFGGILRWFVAMLSFQQSQARLEMVLSLLKIDWSYMAAKYKLDDPS